jgi:hypothetical protein
MGSPAADSYDSKEVIAVKRLAVLAALFTLPLLATTVFPMSQGIIENRGQVDDRVLYYTKALGGTIYFTEDAVVLHLKERTRRDSSLPVDVLPGSLRRDEQLESTSRRGCAIYIHFDGANRSPVVAGEGLSPTRYNYFLGSDPAGWRSNVPAYSEVRYAGLWPGVDLGGRRIIKKSAYEVAGAHERARFRYEGADDVTVMEDGSVRLSTPMGVIVDLKAGGMRRGAFVLEGRSHASRGADAGQQDNPDVLLWSTFLGAEDDDYARRLVLDASGNPVVTGHTYSDSFPTTPGAYSEEQIFSGDVFVSKISASGSDLLWSTYLGGTSSDLGDAIRLDESENPVVLGNSSSFFDFPTTPGAYDESHNGHWDVFLFKLSSTGSDLLWSTLLGGDRYENTNELVLDPSGNPIAIGYTESASFPTTVGAYDETYNGGGDAFVCKLSSTGSDLLWSTFLGTTTIERTNALDLDHSGNITIAGHTDSPLFPTTPGVLDESFNGAWDAYVLKLLPDGSDILWSTFLGGETWDVAWGMAVESSGDIVIHGSTTSPDFPTTPGAYDGSINGDEDAFAATLSSTGTGLRWSTFIGGSGWDRGISLVLAPSGSHILTGFTESADFPTTPDAYDRSHNGDKDGYLIRFSPSTSELLFSTLLGGVGREWGDARALDPSGHPILVGRTDSPDFPTTPGAFDESYSGEDDVFVAKLDLPAASSAEDPSARPVGVGLLWIAPNPLGAHAWNSIVEIHYALPTDGFVRLTVYDVIGREVARLVDREQSAGYKSMTWSPRGLMSGIYFCRLEAGGVAETRKVVVLDPGDRR